jgi:hypothetical protein
MRKYRERWQAVAQFETHEQAACSVAVSWQQLNAIMRLAQGLNLSMSQGRDRQNGVEEVRRRWMRLKGVE